MIKLYDYILSADCYKTRLMLALLKREFEPVKVNIHPGRENPLLRHRQSILRQYLRKVGGEVGGVVGDDRNALGIAEDQPRGAGQYPVVHRDAAVPVEQQPLRRFKCLALHAAK